MALKEERLLETKGHFLERACSLELFEYYAESFQCIKAVFVENYFPRRHLEENATVFALQDRATWTDNILCVLPTGQSIHWG